MDPKDEQKLAGQKVVVDQSKCIGCGLCASTCSDVFELDESGKSKVKDDADCEKAGCCQEAVDNCPAEAISWSKQD